MSTRPIPLAMIATVPPMQGYAAKPEVYGIDADGVVWRNADGSWKAVEAPQPMVGISASPTPQGYNADVFAVDIKGNVWRYDFAEWHPFAGPSVEEPDAPPPDPDPETEAAPEA